MVHGSPSTGLCRFMLIWLTAATLCAAEDGTPPPTAPGPEGDTKGAFEEARRKAAHRPRRIIMNNDGNDARQLDPDGPRTVEQFLSRRTSPLVGSHVDAIFYCTGVFNLYTHRSEETEPLGVGETSEWAWAPELARLGTDPLEATIAFGKEHDIEVFWSMRMNDTHDSSPDSRHLLCEWKRRHPEYLMGTPEDRFPYGGRRWSAVDYARPEVRDKVFRILKDVCGRYDVDGIELDFFRHPVYFRPQMTGEPVTREHRDMMTGLLRRIRAMTERTGERRGRPLLIAVRVPDSVGFAREIGLDTARWMEEDLVDMIAGGGYFHLEPWEHLARLGRRHGVPVYAVLSGSRLVDTSRPENPGDIRIWRGEALRAWDAGVTGIYTFNRFVPDDPIFRELGDPQVLRERERSETPVPGRGMNYWLKDGERFLLIGR